MYLDIVPNRNSPPAILLRESIRQGDKIIKRTLANLSSLTIEQAQQFRLILKGKTLIEAQSYYEIIQSQPHGHVEAVLTAMKRLGLARLIHHRRCDERDLIMALIASRILNPESKLALSRSWNQSTLGGLLEINDASDDALYAAMDWLFERQDAIEAKLAKRHLNNGGRVLYDLSSSYFEGCHCPLAARGYSRDQKKGKLQVNYGLMTDSRGCPVAISAFPGNTMDSKTLLNQVDRLQTTFGLDSVVLVGDRGMISQKQIDELSGQSGIDWITALRTGAIRKLVTTEAIQLSLFDEHNLFEFTHPDFPGEKLVACRNPDLAIRRKRTRQSLLDATVKELEKVQAMISRGSLKDADKIGVRVGKVVNRYKMSKHFKLDIAASYFHFEIDAVKVSEEAALDGIYVIRSSLTGAEVSAEEAVRHYKALSQVERAFRSMKTMDLEVRPIRHYHENRVRTHLFICMLAYYVKWHMMEAWRPVLFADDDQHAKQNRDPVATAKRSDAALAKISSKQLPDGSPAHSFQSLLGNLSTIVRNHCRRQEAEINEACFTIDTTPSPEQTSALQLLNTIKM